jgi:putative transposase
MGNCHVRFLGEGDGATRSPLPDKQFGRYDSITYPQYGNGVRLEGTTLILSKIGSIGVKLHRPVEGRIKTVTLEW